MDRRSKPCWTGWRVDVDSTACTSAGPESRPAVGGRPRGARRSVPIVTLSLATSDAYGSARDVHDEAVDRRRRAAPALRRAARAARGAGPDAPSRRRSRTHMRERGVAFRSGGEVQPFGVDPVPRLIERAEWDALARGHPPARARAGGVRRRRLRRARDRARRARPGARDRERRPLRARADGRRAAARSRSAWPGSTSCATPTAGWRCSRTTCARRRGSATRRPRATALDATLAGRRRRPAGCRPTRAPTCSTTRCAAAAPDGVGDPAIARAHRRAAEQRLVRAPRPLRAGSACRSSRARPAACAATGSTPGPTTAARASCRSSTGAPTRTGCATSDGQPTWLAERAARAAARRQPGGRQPARRGRRRRQARARLRRRDDPLLPRRGAAAAVGADLRPRRDPDQRRDGARPARRPRRQAALGPRRRRASSSAGTRPRGPRAHRRARSSATPARWIAQETVTLSTHPTVVDGALEPRHVDLRAFAIGDAVVAGGLTRFARDARRARRQQLAGRRSEGHVGGA